MTEGKKRPFADFFQNRFKKALKRYLRVTPTKAFSCEYCEIFKNSFFHRTPPVAAFGGSSRIFKLYFGS